MTRATILQHATLIIAGLIIGGTIGWFGWPVLMPPMWTTG